MCIKRQTVLEGYRDLFIAPSRFFQKDKNNHWNKQTLATLWIGMLGITFLLSVLHEIMATHGLEITAQNLWKKTLSVIATYFQTLIHSWQLLILGPSVLFLFLWGTSHVVKAPLHWRQVFMLCLFFTLPSLLMINLILFPLLFFIQNTTALMITQVVTLIVITLWSLTLMTLGTQAYSNASWQRSLIAILPVAMILFLQISGAITTTLLTLIGLTLPIEPPPSVNPLSF